MGLRQKAVLVMMKKQKRFDSDIMIDVELNRLKLMILLADGVLSAGAIEGTNTRRSSSD